MKVYFAHIFSHLIYLNPLWSSVQEYRMNELKVLQNKAIKSILRLPWRTPSVSLNNVRFLPMDVINEYETILLFFKLSGGCIKHGVKLMKNDEIHAHFTRSNKQYHLNQIHTVRYGRKGILHGGLLLYNNIINSIKITMFKSKLRLYLWMSYLDSLKQRV